MVQYEIVAAKRARGLASAKDAPGGSCGDRPLDRFTDLGDNPDWCQSRTVFGKSLVDAALLVTAAREGDHAAWEAICTRHRADLLRLARHILASYVNVDVSGVVQATLMKAWSNHDQLDAADETQLVGWLKEILRNTATDEVRAMLTLRRDVSRESPIPEGSNGEPMLADTCSTPSAQAVRQEEESELRERIAALTERERQIVDLRVKQQQSWDEIAKAVDGPSADAVKKAFFRAVDRMKSVGEDPR